MRGSKENSGGNSNGVTIRYPPEVRVQAVPSLTGRIRLGPSTLKVTVAMWTDQARAIRAEPGLTVERPLMFLKVSVVGLSGRKTTWGVPYSTVVQLNTQTGVQDAHNRAWRCYDDLHAVQRGTMIGLDSPGPDISISLTVEYSNRRAPSTPATLPLLFAFSGAPAAIKERRRKEYRISVRENTLYGPPTKAKSPPCRINLNPDIPCARPRPHRPPRVLGQPGLRARNDHRRHRIITI